MSRYSRKPRHLGGGAFCFRPLRGVLEAHSGSVRNAGLPSRRRGPPEQCTHRLSAVPPPGLRRVQALPSLILSDPRVEPSGPRQLGGSLPSLLSRTSILIIGQQPPCVNCLQGLTYRTYLQALPRQGIPWKASHRRQLFTGLTYRRFQGRVYPGKASHRLGRCYSFVSANRRGWGTSTTGIALWNRTVPKCNKPVTTSLRLASKTKGINPSNKR